MKFSLSQAALLIPIFIVSCQNPGNKPAENSASTQVEAAPAPADTRPAAQVTFLSKVKAASDYELKSSAIKKDQSITAFNKYAKDSLKNIKDWVFQVTEINDNSYDAISVIKVLGNPDGTPIYNLMLVSEIEDDPKADTISIGNRVNFTYTTTKNPKSADMKKNLEVIKGLKPGDIVVISGSLMHVNDQGKVDYAPFYESSLPWNVDLMITSIKKKE